MKIEINLRVVCINRYDGEDETDLIEGKTYDVDFYHKRWIYEDEFYRINGKWYSKNHFITEQENKQLENIIHELIK